MFVLCARTADASGMTTAILSLSRCSTRGVFVACTSSARRRISGRLLISIGVRFLFILPHYIITLSGCPPNGLCAEAVIDPPGIYLFLWRDWQPLTVPPEPTWPQVATLSSGGEGVFSGDPSAGSKRLKMGWNIPFREAKQGGKLLIREAFTCLPV